MKNSINNLKNQFSCTEVLSTEQCCAVKGGGGEDLRKSLVSAANTVIAYVEKSIATYSATKG